MLMPNMLLMLGLCHCGQRFEWATIAKSHQRYAGICCGIPVPVCHVNVTASSMHNDSGRWWRPVVGFVYSRVGIGSTAVTDLILKQSALATLRCDVQCDESTADGSLGHP